MLWNSFISLFMHPALPEWEFQCHHLFFKDQAITTQATPFILQLLMFWNTSFIVGALEYLTILNKQCSWSKRLVWYNRFLLEVLFLFFMIMFWMIDFHQKKRKKKKKSCSEDLLLHVRKKDHCSHLCVSKRRLH